MVIDMEYHSVRVTQQLSIAFVASKGFTLVRPIGWNRIHSQSLYNNNGCGYGAKRLTWSNAVRKVIPRKRP